MLRTCDPVCHSSVGVWHECSTEPCVCWQVSGASWRRQLRRKLQHRRHRGHIAAASAHMLHQYCLGAAPFCEYRGSIETLGVVSQGGAAVEKDAQDAVAATAQPAQEAVASAPLQQPQLQQAAPMVHLQYAAVLTSTQQYSAVLSSIRRYSAVLIGIQQYSSVFSSTRQYSAVLIGAQRYTPVLIGTH